MVIAREQLVLIWNRELQSPGCANLKWVLSFMALENYGLGKSKSFHCVRIYRRIVQLSLSTKDGVRQIFSLMAKPKQVSALTNTPAIFTPDSIYSLYLFELTQCFGGLLKNNWKIGRLWHLIIPVSKPFPDSGDASLARLSIWRLRQCVILPNIPRFYF